MSARLTVAMIAHNEESIAAQALESVNWADEIVFVDCGSTDGTAAIAAGMKNVRLFNRENSLAVYVNKQFAIDQASGDWILILDADEEVSPALRDEIIRLLAYDRSADAYDMPRRNFYFGRWLRHGGKYPDTQLRLFRKGCGAYLPLPVHEKLKINGKIEHLPYPLHHYPYRTEDDLRRKLPFYAEALSESYILKRKNPLMLRLRPLFRFFSGYLFKLGFLDGIAGFRTAFMDMFIVHVSVIRYRQKIKNRSLGPDTNRPLDP